MSIEKIEEMWRVAEFVETERLVSNGKLWTAIVLALSKSRRKDDDVLRRSEESAPCRFVGERGGGVTSLSTIWFSTLTRSIIMSHLVLEISSANPRNLRHDSFNVCASHYQNILCSGRPSTSQFHAPQTIALKQQRCSRGSGRRATKKLWLSQCPCQIKAVRSINCSYPDLRTCFVSSCLPIPSSQSSST